jgi:two-component system NtrC family sensor kinase
LKKISNKLIILLILAALIPLAVFGMLSIMTSRSANYETVSKGNLNVARRAADQIELYVTNAIFVLRAIAENINRTYLEDWQKERVIKNFVLNFEEFHQIYLTDQDGRQIATTKLGAELTDKSDDPAFKAAVNGEVYQSDVYISKNLTPYMTIALPIKKLNEVDGVIVAEINLIDMWNLVDGIKIGKKGFAFVVSKSGLLIAHGEADAKTRVLKQENLRHLEMIESLLGGNSGTHVYRSAKGEKMLGVYAPIKSLGWGVVIEQPTKEAYSTAITMTYQLIALTSIFLIIMVAIGILGGRKVVEPVRELIRGTRLISDGDLTHKVRVSTKDELSELGNSFNKMTERLIDLQDEIRRNERSATFGKIAAGLVHDLRHPIKNIENCARLIMRRHESEDYRKTFNKTVDRELANINRFLEDLHNLTHQIPLTFINLSVEKILDEVIDLCQEEAKQRNIQIIRQYHAGKQGISADRFAVERVFKNLIANALEAMAGGGDLRISTALLDSQMEHSNQRSEVGQAKTCIQISIADSGCGISKDRLATIFTEYTTTKRKGLGLGLAISKRIVETLNGSIHVESELGRGTTFKVRFPLA